MSSDQLQKIEVLMTAELAPISYPPFDDHFTVHRLWKISDHDAFFNEVGPRIRGMVAAGNKKIGAELFDRLPNLEVISNFGVGYDRLDLDAVVKRGLIATNTPDVLTEEVADLTLGLLLATVRELPQADRFVREGRWKQGPFHYTASLRGRTVGIAGLGRIGKAIAKRCEAFGLGIAYYGRKKQEVPYRYYPRLVDMAREVEVLIVAVPGGDDTNALVNGEVLKSLGPDGILINIARGSAVDQAALLTALRDRSILGAGLDVFWDEPNVPSELLELENVVLLPHVGSASVKTRLEMIDLVLQNLIAWFRGRGPLTPIPETPWTGRLASVRG